METSLFKVKFLERFPRLNQRLEIMVEMSGPTGADRKNSSIQGLSRQFEIWF